MSAIFDWAILGADLAILGAAILGLAAMGLHFTGFVLLWAESGSAAGGFG
jgi:hypothetical protein